MSCLADGPPPEITKITIGERNAELCHEENKEKITKSRKGNRVKFPDYRRYDLTGAALKSPQSLAAETRKPAFIPSEDGLISKFNENWEANGFIIAVKQLSESSEVSDSIKTILDVGVNALVMMQKMKNKVLEHQQIPMKTLMKTYSLIPNWSVSIIKAFCVHPHIQVFAAAYKDDIVKIFSANRFNDFEPVLKDKRQKDVSCIAFRPLSAAHIGIGCKDGILLWTLDPNSSGMRPGSNQHRFLSHPGHSPVTSLTWSRTGRLLASGSVADAAIMVWDVLLQRSTPLRRVGSGICFLSWSPRETRLLSSTTKEIFRIWESKSWTCEKWSNLAGRCHVACWSPCGKYLVFTIKNECSLYYLYLNHDQDDCNVKSSSSGLAVKCFDFTKCSWSTEVDGVCAGGTVQSMAWDPTGSRLAMIFRGADDTGEAQSHVGLFRTTLSPIFEISPCGFIGGDREETPLAVSFLSNYNQGALLLVCWSTGMVSQIPLLFHAISSERQNVTNPSALPNRADEDCQRAGPNSPENLYSVAES